MLDRTFGFNGAPHSSQYCEPSRFSVLHLAHEIMVQQSRQLIIKPETVRGKNSILARNQRARQLIDQRLSPS
jgi:hypothetical protein